jgi:hypothetical protein
MKHINVGKLASVATPAVRIWQDPRRERDEKMIERSWGIKKWLGVATRSAPLPKFNGSR